MNWSLVTNEWRLKLLALGLGILMLGAVAFSQNPPTVKTVDVPPSYTVPPNIVLLNPPTKVTVTLTGLSDALGHVDSSNVFASIDATRALPGANVKLNVVARTTVQTVTPQNPPPIVVNVDTRQVQEVPVQVVAHAAPGWSITKTSALCPGSTTPNPCKVHFDGPVSWEKNLAATATYSQPVSTGTLDIPNQQVALTNSNGAVDLTQCRTQPCAVLDVNSVNIHVEAAAGASSSTVALVISLPTHNPPNGYEITGVSISPTTVIINGDPAAVSHIQRITLPGVDLSNSTSDVTFQVNITYPNGTSGSVQTATVKYSISRNPAVQPTPT
jgi:YbbR domain-containing protein